MHNPKKIMEYFDEFRAQMELRDPNIDLEGLYELYTQKKDYEQELQSIRERKNKISNEIGNYTAHICIEPEYRISAVRD